MNVNIANILLDKSIQCRADLSTETVNDYADQMTDGAKFPPVVLFGDPATVNAAGGFAYIGDGWHRVLAAIQVGFKDIDADVRPGDRKAALAFALSANGTHGLKRTNADKRRAVEIALVEFGERSSRQIAEMCGVSHTFVESARDQVETVATSKRTGADGKAYPATKPASEPSDDPDNIPGFREQDASEPSAASTDDSPDSESIWPDGLPDFAKGKFERVIDAIDDLYGIKPEKRVRPLAVQAINTLMGELKKLEMYWRT